MNVSVWMRNKISIENSNHFMSTAMYQAHCYISIIFSSQWGENPMREWWLPLWKWKTEAYRKFEKIFKISHTAMWIQKQSQGLSNSKPMLLTSVFFLQERFYAVTVTYLEIHICMPYTNANYSINSFSTVSTSFP